MFGTKLRRSPAQEAAIKWQIEIIGTKLFFENANKKLDKFGYQNRKNDLPTNSPTNDPN